MIKMGFGAIYLALFGIGVHGHDGHGSCTDTPGWHNLFSRDCPVYDHKFCQDGAALLGFEYSLGEKYNYPERNCCSCGKASWDHKYAQCEDTRGWLNNYMRDCPMYDVQYCSRNGVVRPGLNFSIGKKFNYPERNCCSCGKVLWEEALAGEVCQDTPRWSNSFRRTCETYDREYCLNANVRPGFEFTLGSKYNFPEMHCCSCGKAVKQNYLRFDVASEKKMRARRRRRRAIRRRRHLARRRRTTSFNVDGGRRRREPVVILPPPERRRRRVSRRRFSPSHYLASVGGGGAIPDGDPALANRKRKRGKGRGGGARKRRSGKGRRRTDNGDSNGERRLGRGPSSPSDPETSVARNQDTEFYA